MAASFALLFSAAPITSSGQVTSSEQEEARSRSIGRPPGAFRLKDTHGNLRSLSDWQDQKAVVLVFIGTTCPAANRDLVRLAGFVERYSPRGVTFVGVNSLLEESAEEVARHARDRAIPFPVLKDDSQELARELGAKTTPEAFLLDQGRVLRYRGEVGEPADGDLAAALEAVLAGKAVERAVTPVWGCPITFPRPQRAAVNAGVTFHQDILPILQNRCQPCHRPGQSAPFSLLTFAEASRRSEAIRNAVGARRMPPWLAEPGHGDFAGSRRLSEVEMALIGAWADSGAPEGDPRSAPPAREWPGGWALGRPDLVLSPAKSYQVAASGEDEFRVFVLPTKLTSDQHLAAVEFRPGHGSAVHHMALLVDRTGRGRALDAADPQPGYNSGPGGVLIPSAELIGLWSSGTQPRVLPQGTGRLLQRGADLLLQVHYHRTGKVETDRSTVALHFRREPVTRLVRTVVMGASGPAIPPGHARFPIRHTDTLPAGIRLLSITPHMHLLGKEMRVTATLPDGSTRSLAWVRNWDYRWQETYHFREPVTLPRGTRVDLEAYFDNSAENPLNPNRPPKEVGFGDSRTDEMASVILDGVAE